MTSPELTVLVLGVGGNVSQGILKALGHADLEVRVVAGCVDARGAGLFAADAAYVSPAAVAPAFFDWLTETCERESVDAVLSGVEPVLAAIAPRALELRERTGAVCVVSPPEVLWVGQDKLATCEWLRDQGLAHPGFAASDDREAVRELVALCGFPLIVKPRRGKGAKGVTVVESEQQLDACLEAPGTVVQELLGTPDHEYTTGCFCDREGRVRGAMVMRRELSDGTTYRAEAGAFPAVAENARELVEALAPLGPCNVQSRLVDGVAIPFEVNVRFSGTTPIRARMGFNEVEAALRHVVLGEPAPELTGATEGIALRYWNEMYADPAAMAELESHGRAEDPASGSATEPWGRGPS